MAYPSVIIESQTREVKLTTPVYKIKKMSDYLSKYDIVAVESIIH